MTDEIRIRNPIEAVGYAVLQHVCMIDPEISDGAYRTYHTYLYYAQQNAKCWPNRKTVAEIRGVSEITVSRWNTELEKAGYISRERRMNASSITWIEDIWQNERLKALAAQVLGSRIKNDTTDVSNMKPPSYHQRDEEELTTEELTIEEIDTDELEEDLNEPRRIPDGEEFEDDDPKRKKRVPKTHLQIRMCNVTGRKYLAPEEVTKISRIEKAMLPLTGGLVSKYPWEWVHAMIDWAEDKNAKRGTVVTLKSLLNLINNEKKRVEFIAKWQEKNPGIRLRNNERPLHQPVDMDTGGRKLNIVN